MGRTDCSCRGPVPTGKPRKALGDGTPQGQSRSGSRAHPNTAAHCCGSFIAVTEGSKPNGTAPKTPEYDAFHDLASKLVKVPKEELDEARKRERASKG